MVLLKIKGKMVEKEETMPTLAKKIGMSSTSLSYKINGKRQLKKSDIQKIAKALNIPTDKIGYYFFS